MSELQIDVTVANRFISSLSKSLQALCHGCMDFDTGIEIIGYINVSIDNGSKVDYVLNEKVLKSTTNSMTFVSNSFLARKEQTKQTRDGCCSPVQDLLVPPHMSPYSSLVQGAHIGSQYHRSTLQLSSHAQRGSQKRMWAGEWRMSPKRQKYQNYSGELYLSTHSQSSNQTFTESNFKQPQLPSATVRPHNDDNQPPLINVKRELEADTPLSDIDHSSQSPSCQTQDSSSDLVSQIKVKTDPDAFSSNSDDNSVSGDNTSVSANLKDSFLQTHSLEETSQQDQNLSTEECNSQTATSQILPLDSPLKEHTVNNNNQSSHSTPQDQTETELSYDNKPSASGLPEELAQGAEDEFYSPSTYSDAGEGSSDAGQFDIIEIDDEDEDVQAMFNDPRDRFHRGHKSHHVEPCVSSLAANSMTSSDCCFTKTASSFNNQLENPHPLSVIWKHQCPLCSIMLADRTSFNSHMFYIHGHKMRFTCTLCGKGYLSASGLNRHMLVHEGKSYLCPLCYSKFTQKSSMKTHLRGIHKSAQCLVCLDIFSIGKEFDDHVLHCDKQE